MTYGGVGALKGRCAPEPPWGRFFSIAAQASAWPTWSASLMRSKAAAMSDVRVISSGFSSGVSGRWLNGRSPATPRTFPETGSGANSHAQAGSVSVPRPAARLGPHAVLGREVLRQEPVFLGLRAEEAQASPVAQRHRNPTQRSAPFRKKT